MKALSVRQPWAWALLHAGKGIENRSRSTRYRGPLLIQASKFYTRAYWDDAIFAIDGILMITGRKIELPTRDEVEFGGIIGQVDVVDCITRSNDPWFTGRYGYVVANPKLLPFQSCTGKLNMFDINERAIAA